MVRLRLLGPVQLEGEGAELGPRDRVVLEALAVHPGRVVSVDGLADALWADAAPASRGKVIQGCVMRLRRTLGSQSIATDAAGYRLALRGDELDTTQFERLVERGRTQAATGEPEQAAATFTRALALWRGAPFQELDGWAPGQTEAARLEELRRTSQEDLLEARLAAGEHRDVVADAEARVAEEPLREHRWAILALAQWRCGRQADALRSLHAARRTLADELGVDPGPELAALEDAILRQDPSLASGAEVLPLALECPYKGLAPYEAADADSFFGRDDEVSACLRRLSESPLLVVAGPSGCGKSSLVQAGVVPALVRGGRAVAVFLPGADPDGALTSVLAGHDDAAVLVVDQLEEAFTLNEAEAARTFCGRLATYAADVAPVIVTVRSDHLSSLGAEALFTKMAERGLHLVRPLEHDALRVAIEGPATQAGLRMERGLVDLLLRDAEGEPGALPLLSHALAETWARREGRVLTVEGYRATGGIRGAVARSADRLYESLPPDQRAVLRSVMLRLVAPSPDGEPYRSRIPTRTLGADAAHERVISLLVRARLVTAEAETVELAHEALARAWPRLRSWLDDDAEGQKILRHLATAADGWDSLGREPSELYRGARLEQALEWQAASTPDITPVERDFLDASTAAAASERAALRRQNRRLRRLLVGVGVLLVAALVTGAVAVWQRQRADHSGEVAAAQEREARLRAVVSDSLALRATDRDAAALLAVEAHRLSPTVATESALFSAFTGAPGLERIGHFQGRDADLAVFVDEDTVAITDLRGQIHLVDPARAREEATLPPLGDSDGRTWLSASKDGHWLAAAWRPALADETQAQLTVYDVGTRTPRFVTSGLPFVPGSVAINADGSLVAISGGDEGRTQIRDGATGELRQEVLAIPRPSDAHLFVNTAAVLFAADGKLIVSSQAGPIRWIDPATGAETKRIDARPETSEYYLRLSPDGASLMTDGWAGHMRYDVASGAGIWPAPLTDPYCNDTAWAEHLNAFLCADPTTDELHALDPATGVSTGTRYGIGNDGIVSPDGTTLVQISGTAYSVWRLDGAGPVTTPLGDPKAEWLNGFTPNGDVMVGHAGRPVHLLDPVTGADHGELTGVEQIIPSPSGEESAAVYLDHTIGWYDLNGRAPAGPRAPLPLPSDQVLPVRQKDSQMLFQGVMLLGRRAVLFTNIFDDDGWRLHVRSVDLDQGAVAEPTRDEEPFEWERWLFAPDDQHLYSYDWNFEIHALDLQTGVEGSDLGAKFNDVIAGPGGVVAALIAGDVVQLDPGTLDAVGGPFPAARGDEADLALSGDGHRVLEVGSLGVRLYDVGTHTELGEPLPPSVGVFDATRGFRDRGVALRQDGKAAAALAPGGLVTWDLDPAHWDARACELAGRNLTRAEWSKYIGALDSYHAICPQFAADS
jgi:DNA-binding SARP family transcriptional activator